MSVEVDSNNIPFIKIGLYKIQLEKEPLSSQLQEKSRRELRETPENVEYALKKLRSLLQDVPNLTVPLDDEEFLMKFLRPCKFYPESALEQMKKFYNFKKKYQNHCYGLLPSKERNVFHQGVIGFQELRDNNGSRILTIQSGAKWKPSECSLEELFKGMQIALEAAMAEPKTQVGGVVVILDMKGFSLTHVVQFTPTFAKIIVDWIQESIPLRLKGIHIVNQPYIFNMVFAIFKPLLKEKLRKRIHFHGEDRASLMKFLPAKVLRPDFGGTMDMPEVPGDLLCELLCRYDDDFKLTDSFGFDRSLKSKS